MDIVIPKSLLGAEPIDSGESDEKLEKIQQQHQRSLALSLGFSATAAAEDDDGRGASCYGLPFLSSERFPPLVFPSPVLTGADPNRRRKTIAAVTGHDSVSNRKNQYLVHSSYPPPARKSSLTTHPRQIDGEESLDDSEMTGLKTNLQSVEANDSVSLSYLHQQLLLPVSMVKSFFELSALGIDGKMVQFSKFNKRMILVANVASGDKNAAREFTQLNDLTIAYGTRGLSILAFPCNQFGGCEPYENHEILNCLRYVRPGRNFKPRFHLMGKCDVRGPTTHPVFEYLRQRLPISCDETRHPKSPEIASNFEKFLISPDGIPLKRYTSRTRAAALAFDIEEVLKRTFPHKIAKSKLNLFEEPSEHDGNSEENGKKRLRRLDSKMPIQRRDSKIPIQRRDSKIPIH